MPPKQGQPPPPPPPAEDDEEECVSNKEVHTMMKAMTKLFTKNQQSTDTTLERVERFIAGIIDWVCLGDWIATDESRQASRRDS
jgi:hypothetical protein